MKSLLVLPMLLILAGCSSLIKPSATVTRQQRSVTDFKAIEVHNNITVVVTMTDHDHETIEVEASDNLHQYIVTEKDGNKLVIRMQDNIQIDEGGVLKVYVSARKLEDLIASGASAFELTNMLSEDKIDLTLSGSSSFKCTIEADKLEADLSGASIADISGTADKIDLDESGASRFGGYNLVADDLKAELDGASRAEVTVNKTVKVDASGASILDFKGAGEVSSKDLSGGAAVNKL